MNHLGKPLNATSFSTPQVRRTTSRQPSRTDIKQRPAAGSTAPSATQSQPITRKSSAAKYRRLNFNDRVPVAPNSAAGGGTRVKVVLRRRPLTEDERRLGVETGGLRIADDKRTALIERERGDEQLEFKFDDICDDFHTAEEGGGGSESATTEEHSQSRLYQLIGFPLVDQLIEQSYNCCVLAYGQTGAGKSYTMTGSGSCSGFVQRFVADVLTRLSNGIALGSTTITVSYFEIYNEQVHDLLVDQPKDHKTNLRVREHPEKGIYVENLSERAIHKASDFFTLLQHGAQNRHTAATCFNRESSRSHAVIQLSIAREMSQNVDGKEATFVRRSTAYIVDLAGSEKLAKEMNDAQQSLIKESIKINQSLFTLRRIIRETAESGSAQRVVPFRDSTLTWILKDSLTRNACVTLLCCVSPVLAHKDVTLSTLKFGADASCITTQPRANTDYLGQLLIALKQKDEELRQVRDQAKENQAANTSTETAAAVEWESQRSLLVKQIHQVTQQSQERMTKLESAENTVKELTKNIGVPLWCDAQSQVPAPCVVQLNADPALNALHDLHTCTHSFTIGTHSSADVKLPPSALCANAISVRVGADSRLSLRLGCSGAPQHNNLFINGLPARNAQTIVHCDRLCIAPDTFLLVCTKSLSKFELSRLVLKHNYGTAKAELLHKQLNDLEAAAERQANEAFESGATQAVQTLQSERDEESDKIGSMIERLRRRVQDTIEQDNKSKLTNSDRQQQQRSMTQVRQRLNSLQRGDDVNPMSVDLANRQLIPAQSQCRFVLPDGMLGSTTVELHDCKNERLLQLNAAEFKALYRQLTAEYNATQSAMSLHNWQGLLRPLTNWRPLTIEANNSQAVRRSLAQQEGSSAVRQMRQSLAKVARKGRVSLLFAESIQEEKPQSETQLLLGCVERLSDDGAQSALGRVLQACVRLCVSGQQLASPSALQELFSHCVPAHNTLLTVEAALHTIKAIWFRHLLDTEHERNKASPSTLDQLPAIAGTVGSMDVAIGQMVSAFSEFCRTRAHGALDEQQSCAAHIGRLIDASHELADGCGQAMAMTNAARAPALLSVTALNDAQREVLRHVYSGYLRALAQALQTCTAAALSPTGRACVQCVLDAASSTKPATELELRRALAFYYEHLGVCLCQPLLHPTTKQSATASHVRELVEQRATSPAANQRQWPASADAVLDQLQSLVSPGRADGRKPPQPPPGTSV